MDELIAFVRAQLDDDERIARATSPELSALRSFLELSTPEVDADEAHIARWDPARVLAEIEAKRRILDLHPVATCKGSAYCAFCDVEDGIIHGTGPCDTLRLLAQPYVGRDGWREDWATH